MLPRWNDIEVVEKGKYNPDSLYLTIRFYRTYGRGKVINKG